MDYIELITAELEEVETSIRMARRMNEARNPAGFREAMQGAFSRMEYADSLHKTGQAEARVLAREEAA
jgi:hypothetical protein